MTTLGLIGTPRGEAVFVNPGSSTTPRPDTGSLTALGLDGVAAFPNLYEPKGGDSTPVARPDGGTYSVLGLGGVSEIPWTFTPKHGTRGIVGRTTLALTPQATIAVARSYRIVADLVLGLRPMGAVITVAHTSNRQGRTTLGFGVRATLRYHREGAEYAFSGGTTLTLHTSGTIRVPRRRSIQGNTTLTLEPRGARVYTPAPIRTHQFSGRTQLRLEPRGTMQQIIGGIHYAFSGTNTISLSVHGLVNVVRQTTYSMHGNVTLTLRPQGTITKGSGPPVDYFVAGSTLLTLTPRGTIGFNLGEVEHYGVIGHSSFTLVPQGRVTLRRAPSVTPLDRVRRGTRRFIRLFNR